MRNKGIVLSVCLCVMCLTCVAQATVTDDGVWEWLDPVCTYQFDATASGLCGVIGTDTWTKESLDGQTMSGTTACAYLCKPGEAAVMPLEIPKFRGTNRDYTMLVQPLFVRKGRWLYATLRHEAGLDMMVCWAISTKRPSILMFWKTGESPQPPKEWALACDYAESCALRDKGNWLSAIVDPHEIRLPNYGRWER